MNLHENIYKEIHLSRCISPSSTYLAKFLNVILTRDPTIPSTHLLSANTNEKHSFLRSANSLQFPKKWKISSSSSPHIGQGTGLTLWPLNFLSLSPISIEPPLKFKIHFISSPLNPNLKFISSLHVSFTVLYRLRDPEASFRACHCCIPCSCNLSFTLSTTVSEFDPWPSFQKYEYPTSSKIFLISCGHPTSILSSNKLKYASFASLFLLLKIFIQSSTILINLFFLNLFSP